MSTSLFQQLERLKAPQTGAIADPKRRASILFDPKEAASKDRKTIYDLGIHGLKELIVLNTSFQQFEQTLFDENTLHMERAVEVKTVNELLNANIKKFLHHLSPYFLLRPAHLCLEWLIRRFQVQDYNCDELMSLILPYHETNAFVKVIQTFRLKSTDNKWLWLKPLQKPGKCLAKSVIINKAATDKGFLNFVCTSTVETFKELGTQSQLLQTQLNFYGSVVVGALEYASSIQEWHIVTLLPSLLKALTSDNIDFVAAAYIITARLVARTQLTPKLCKALILKVAKVKYERLRRTAVLLLIWILDSQKQSDPEITEEALMNLVQQNWLLPTLASLTTENVDIASFLIPIVAQSVKSILAKHKESESFKKFLENTLKEIVLPLPLAKEFISCYLDCFVPLAEGTPFLQGSAIKDGDVIELGSDDDEKMAAPNGETLLAWYTQYLRMLERQYPTAFDFTLKESFSNPKYEESASRREVVKAALGYRLKSLDSSTCDVYESLYHHTATVRLMAIQSLLKNLKDYQKSPQNYQLLKECLADRIKDDCEDVVREVLKLATTEILLIMDTTKFVEALLEILTKIQISPQQWLPLSPIVVKHLTCECVIQNYDQNLILLALMPLIFPVNPEATFNCALEKIITSPLAEHMSFLKNLKVNDKNFNLAEFKRSFLNVISEHDTPSVDALFQSVESQGPKYFKHAMQVYHFLILITASLKPTYSAQLSIRIFKQISGYTKKFPIKHLSSQDWKVAKKLRYIPLQLFSDFMINLTAHTKLRNLEKFSWEDPSAEELHYFLNVFEFVADECFAETKESKEQTEWLTILKELFDTVFKSPSAKLEFLVNFYVHENHLAVKDYPVLRLRAFKILQALLKGSNRSKCNLSSIHVLKISTALLSTSRIMRLESLETLKFVLYDDIKLDDFFKMYAVALVERSEEILMDSEQFPMVLYALLKGDVKNRQKAEMGSKVLMEILMALKKDDSLTQAVFTKQLLQMIVHVNDEEILGSMVALPLEAIKRSVLYDAIRILEEPHASIYQLICARFDPQTIENVMLDNPTAWALFESAFQNYQVVMQQGGKLKSATCVFLESLNEEAVDKMPEKYKQNLLILIIKTLANADNDSIFLAANKLLKRAKIDCKPLAILIDKMVDKTCLETCKHQINKKSTGKREAVQTPIVQVNALSWKQGVVLMEFLENKKNLENTQYLITPLFELLNCCLAVEEQTTVEYTKQLILSALLHCCKRALDNGCDLQTALPKTTFRMDQVVQCLRVSQNPQTHHNALLLLSHCASLFPQQVLHNIVDIFTFMGSSVVRHDDAFSFHIINNIIESVVPVLVKDTSAFIPVLKVFSDIMLDVPEHRRLPLYTKLLTTLGAEKYLWIFLCVVFEAHVDDDEKQRLLQKKSKRKANNSRTNSDQVAKRIEIILELSNTFGPETVLETCLQLMKYVEKLPMQKEEKPTRKLLQQADSSEYSLFDVNARSAKQLRHYKYLIMQFLSVITSSQEFLTKIALLEDDEVNKIKPYYQNLIIRILSFVPLVSAAIEKVEDGSQQKFWKVILHHLHDVLDNTISLLSAKMFLAVVNGLMRHQLLSVRKNVIELLITKLQKKDAFFDNVDSEYFHNLLEPLADIISSIVDESKEIAQANELVFLQQTALIAIKLLSKLFAFEHKTEFKNILTTLTKIMKQRSSISKIVLATVVLTMIEISSNLKAHSIAHLPKFMPQLVDVLQEQADLVRSHSPDNVCVAIVTGMQKLFETLPLFLGPYIVDIVVALSSISTRITAQNNEKDQRSTNTLQKIATTWSKIAKDVPLRIIVPSCDKAYSKMMETNNYEDIRVLMKLLDQAIQIANNKDLTIVHMELTAIFIKTLEFRLQMRDSVMGLENIQTIESAIIEAFVSWVLKLSESSFRPLYHKIYTWAIQQSKQKETILTFFLLTHKVAEALKSLFVLFASDIIEDAARLLNDCNANKADIDHNEEGIILELLKAILSTLYNIFLYDSAQFVNALRFKYLMPSVVDQLENRLVLEQESLQQLLSNCIAQMAVSVSNDVLWKQLNYHLLLKTRTSVPDVRISAFNCCVEIARKLGDDFSPLLPETVPFIAELLEDENPRVEKNTRKSVQELELVIGESLQKYL